MSAAPLEELAVPDEDHSTGTAWPTPGRPTTGVLPAHITPCTPGQQAEHRAELAAAIARFAVGPALGRIPARADSRQGHGR